MRVLNIVQGGVFVALASVAYNVFIFSALELYPSLSFGIEGIGVGYFNFYVVIFLKNLFVGFILMILFSLAYRNIVRDTGETKYTLRAVFFFVLYAIFALVSFIVGDMLLMETSEGMLLLLTLDGFVETVLATVPIRVFAVRR